MENLAVYISACLALCIIPGPDMAFVLSTSIAKGSRAGILASLGINAGAYTHLLAAALGLSAIIATSATAFTIVKWIGAGYMVYLGIRVLFSSNSSFSSLQPDVKPTSNRNIFWMGYLSDVLNPKVAIFYLSFLPQFVSTDSENPLGEILLLGILLNMIGIMANLIIVQFASLITHKLRTEPALVKWLNRFVGVTFLAIGIKIATEKT